DELRPIPRAAGDLQHGPAGEHGRQPGLDRAQVVLALGLQVDAVVFGGAGGVVVLHGPRMLTARSLRGVPTAGSLQHDRSGLVSRPGSCTAWNRPTGSPRPAAAPRAYPPAAARSASGRCLPCSRSPAPRAPERAAAPA